MTDRYLVCLARLWVIALLVTTSAFVVACSSEASVSTEQESPMQEEGMEVEAGYAAASEDVIVEESEFVRNVRSGEYRTVRLVGDSITAGFGTNGFENPDIAAEGTVIYEDAVGNVHYEPSDSIECWANAFRAWAQEHGMQGFVNAGICGWFMHDLAMNPSAWFGEGADVIVIALGTNDAGYYGPQEFAEDAYTALAAAEQLSKLVVVVAPVADLRPTQLLVEPASELGDILQEICAERGYIFVDPREWVTPEMFCDDGLHPNSEGSLAIWECMRMTLGLH